MICIADGLGHGKHAEAAAHAAIEYVERHNTQPLPDIFAGCDARLRSTRGVAMGIAVIEDATGELTYAAVGNTRALVTGIKAIRLPASPGIVGGGYRSLSRDTAVVRHGDLVILSTDGLQEYIEISRYDAALRTNVERLAERIIHDWRHDADDAAVLVFRYTDGR